MIAFNNSVAYSPELDAQFFAAYLGERSHMLDLSKLPRNILNDLTESLARQLNPCEQIKAMSATEAFDNYLRYNGMIGFTKMILEAREAIFAAAIVPPNPKEFEFAETVADIAYELGYAHRKLAPVDSRANIAAIIEAATLFERERKNVVCGEDYIEQIDAYIPSLETFPV